MAANRQIIGLAFGQIIGNVQNIILDSSDEEEDMVEQEANRRIKILNYFEITIPSYCESDFKSHFRLNRQQFVSLTLQLSPFILKQKGAPPIQVEKQILITLWLLGNPESFRSIADRFNCTKSAVNNCINRCVDALNSITDEVISWPNVNQQERIKTEFQRVARLTGVIGAIDGTHIPIKAPHINPEAYINRKGFHSIVLQAVCENNMRFTDCFAGYPGSCHDARILNNSYLRIRIDINQGLYFPRDSHILGDPAYPLQSWLMVPFRDNGHLTNREQNFNTSLSKTRSIIERSFALLKGRWRRLKMLDMNRTDRIPAFIIAACVLHNHCLDDIDGIDLIYEQVVPENQQEYELANYVPNAQNARYAHNKRNMLCNVIDHRQRN